MTKAITIELRNLYGRETAYPSCEISHEFARIARTKTLSVDHLKSIKKLGYTINVIDNRTTSQLMIALSA